MDNEKLKKIGDELWRRTEEDWALEVSHTLTEPTCPTAFIHCENKSAKWPYWRADRDTIEEAIEAVIGLAYAELIEGKPHDNGVPWSEPTLRWERKE